MISIATRTTPVKSQNGELMTITQGVPIEQALERADHTLSSAVIVIEQIPQQQGIAREELAYAAADLLYTAQALIASLREGIEDAK